MKSVITEKLVIQNNIKFPVLMTPKSDPDTIFLMKSLQSGVVVSSKYESLPIGLGINSTKFKHDLMVLFDGAVTLQND